MLASGETARRLQQEIMSEVIVEDSIRPGEPL